jgi:hypothetical protein
MADKLPANTAELLSAIEHEWKELMRVVGRLTPEQMTTPDAGGWSPKDNLAHLSAWMQYMRGCYLEKKAAYVAMNIDQATYEKLDEEGINAALFKRNRDLTPTQVLNQLNRTYSEILMVLRETPFSELMRPVRDNDPRPVIGWVLGNTSDHFAEHRANIEKNL